MKKRPVGEELLHVDRRIDRQTYGRTDMTKLIITSLYFAKGP